MNPIIDLYNDFLLLKKMSIPLKVKKYMLKEFLEVTESPWKVIGVSKQALIALKQNGYKNSGIKLQRAHINDRDVWYNELLSKAFIDYNEWYKFYQDNDKTILALSSENKNIRNVQYFPIDTNLNLFKSTRISWTHKKAEKDYLKDLAEKNSI
jgi:hypothetical protein